MSDGTFGNADRWEWEVLDVHTFDGETFPADELAERIEEADQIFYKVTDTLIGEDFYRWIGGPFHDDLGAFAEAIAEQESDYFDVA